jgi:hypothetical protein
MDKKNRLALILILSLTFTLCLATASLAAPNLLGTWTGMAPKISLSGCSNESISLTIGTQCTNLFTGNVIVGTSTVPMVGKIDPNGNSVQINGSIQGINYEYVNIYGSYVAGTTPTINVISFYHSSSSDTNTQNQEYDNFSLVKH